MTFNKKHLKTLISQDKLEGAIEILIEESTNEKQLNEVILLSNRLNSLKIRERKALVSFDEFKLEKNRIVNSLISIIDTKNEEVNSEQLDDNFETILSGLKKCHLNINILKQETKSAILDLVLVFGDKEYNLLHHLLIFKDVIFDIGSVPRKAKNERGKMIEDSFLLLRDFGLVNLNRKMSPYIGETTEIYEVTFSDLGKKFIRDFLTRNTDKLNLINDKLERIKKHRLD